MYSVRVIYGLTLDSVTETCSLEWQYFESERPERMCFT